MRVALGMQAETRTGSGQSDRGLPAYFIIALLAMVIPLTFEVGALFMTASRTVLLFVTPVLLIRLFGGYYGALTKTDILFGLFVAWFGLAILVQSPERFLTFVGSNFIIMVGAYLLGRCAVRGVRAARQMIVLYGLLVLFSLPFALYEMITGDMPIARLLELIPGISSSADLEYPSRNALERVQFVFVHPIHYGLFCAYIFAMIAVGLRHYLPFALRWSWALVIAFCCFTSGSSGPLLAILISMALIVYGALSGGRWKLLIATLAGLYIVLELLSNRPIYYVIIEKLAFNPGTAYGRRLILDAGLEQITRTPLFGTPAPLPLPDWMTGSLDNYWLLVAVAYGVPALAFLLAAYLYALIQTCRRDFTDDPPLAALRDGWVIAVIGAMFALATVAVWSEILSLTFLVFGSGVWLMNAQAAPALRPTPERQAPRYTRFAAGQPEPCDHSGQNG